MGDNIVINGGTINGGVIQGKNTDAEAEASAVKQDMDKKFDFDVAISYSSEETRYVSRVVQILKAEGLRVFFAPDCEEEYTAKDMIAEFYTIYRYRSMFVAAFVSKSYISGDIIHRCLNLGIKQGNSSS